MLSRRRFLTMSGLGMLSFPAVCQPGMLQGSAFGNRHDALERLRARRGQKQLLLGYPINMNTPSPGFFAWRDELFQSGIDEFAFNNVGNPFAESPIPFNTHDFERDTIEAFGALFAFPTDDTWGFLSHSGTDSNMHGMYMGRTLLKGRTGRLPKAYFTREAHYSVQILRDLLGLETVMVQTRVDGGMDPADLAGKLAEHSDAPALVVATVGTTFKGAVDNVDEIRGALRDYPSYLHVDAALFGGYLPFTSFASEVAHRSEADDAGRYDSIAVSCHKFFGFPSPAGIFVTRRRLYDEFNALFSQIHNPEYIHHVPGTITCSRDAVKPAEFYYFTTPSAQATQQADAQQMLNNASYLLDAMQTNFPELAPVRSNPMSNTIYFRHPGDALVEKYSLATMQLTVDDEPLDYAHVVVMPHVTHEVLNEFLTDIEHR